MSDLLELLESDPGAECDRRAFLEHLAAMHRLLDGMGDAAIARLARKGLLADPGE